MIPFMDDEELKDSEIEKEALSRVSENFVFLNKNSSNNRRKLNHRTGSPLTKTVDRKYIAPLVDKHTGA